jgi:hypothetical protein
VELSLFVLVTGLTLLAIAFSPTILPRLHLAFSKGKRFPIRRLDRKNRLVAQIRKIYQNPELVHKLSQWQIYNYLMLFDKRELPLMGGSYSDTLILFIQARRISKKQLNLLWTVNRDENIRAAILKSSKLSKTTKTLYALEALAYGDRQHKLTSFL